MSKRSVLTARIAADPHVATATRVESTASRTAESTWSDISFRNLLPRSDVSVVTLPMEGNHAVAAGGGAKDRILHFVIGGQTSESSESDIVEAIEWHCRRSWRMASLNCARLGCGAALLRGVIYTVGGLSSDSTVLSSVEKFSFFQEEKRWDLLSKLSDLKTPRWGHAVVSLQRHNAIFAVGGRNASWEELSSVEVAQQNAAGDLQWNRLPYGMRQKRFGATAAMVTSASIMVCGGFNGSAWTKTVCQYEVEGDDVRDGTWIDLPDMPKPVVFGKATATTLNGSLFVFVAGASEDGQSVLQAFSVKQQKWSIMETNGGEDGCSLAVEGDTLLCVGGDSNVVRSLNLTMECEQGSLVALCGGVQGLSVGIPEVAAVAQNSFSSMSAEPQRVEKKACVVEGENAQYTGEINAAGQRHGKGLLVWANKDGTFLPKEMSKNSYYEGGFDQDYRRGEGVLFVMEEGRLYQGNFERGVLSGPGTLIDVMLRLQYDGGFRKGMPIGEGRCDYSDTRRSFIGTWKRGKPIAGRLVDADDRVLQSIGPWSKELFIDLSRAGTPRTDEITGPSTVNKKDCMVENEKAQYSGPLNERGQRHGHGRLVWADDQGNFHDIAEKKNSFYIGESFEDSRSGSGEMFVKEENRTYRGTFDRGVLVGQGSLEDGLRNIQYTGQFKRGSPHGEGTCVYSTLGRLFVGRWRRGHPIDGKLYNQQGQVVQEGSGNWNVDLSID